MSSNFDFIFHFSISSIIFNNLKLVAVTTKSAMYILCRQTVSPLLQKIPQGRHQSMINSKIFKKTLPCLLHIFSCNALVSQQPAAEIKKSLGGLGSSTVSFHEQVTLWLDESSIAYQDISVSKSPYRILGLGQNLEGDSYDVGLHILPTPTQLSSPISPTLCKTLTDDNSTPFQTIIHLHQDVWNNKDEIVKARISAKVKEVNHRWFARKTTLRRIDITTAMTFLQEHHLWGATRSKFNYGLFAKDDELVAVATFSPRRHVQRGNSSRPYRSHELIRYCAQKDGHVIGGITKLVAGFCKDFAPDDLVTCIDRDWGDGSGWQGIGFERVSVMPPLVMAVGGDGIRRYMVGAGIGKENQCDKDDRNGRPGISLDTFGELDSITDHEDANSILASQNLCPVYDAGVERRILLVANTKLDSKASIRRRELGIEDLDVSEETNAADLWGQSVPSFPNEYYSSNSGINSLLQYAKEKE